MQEKVLEIYNKIKPQLDELKGIAIQKMYDEYFSKNEKTKEFIDSLDSKEDGIASLIGQSYFYSLMEEFIILLVDPFMNGNTTDNHKVPSWLDSTNSNIFLPNQPYHRFSQFDFYCLNNKYSNSENYAYRIFDSMGNKNQDDIEKIKSVIATLDICDYLGFMAFDNGYFAELYEYDGSSVYLFKVIFKNNKLEVVGLEIWENETPKATC